MNQPDNKSELEQEFWKTLELLVGKDRKRTEKDVLDDVQDWVDKFVSKKDAIENDEYLLTGSSKKSDESSGYGSGHSKEVKRFLKRINIPETDCKFGHPYVRSRLEKLMGSNIVSLTDRAYMQQLQERILENYANDMNKRIAAREAAEMERVKNLVLSGRIPLDDAPPEMVDHPVRLIEMYCRKLIAERRAKIKVQTVYIPKRSYPDDTPDPASGLSIENGHIFRGPEERLCHSPRTVLRVSDEEDVQRGFMFTDEEYAKLNLEGPLIQRLRNAQTVEEMYKIADEIMKLPEQ